MNRRIAGLSVVSLGLIVLASHTLAADSTDKLTALPLHAGLRFNQEVDSPVCGNDAQMDLYGMPRTATTTLAELVGWYKEQLKGFHYVHKVWSDRSHELFYSPDGSKGVGINGMPSGPGVYGVDYLKFSVHLTTHQMDEFGPSNPTCK